VPSSMKNLIDNLAEKTNADWAPHKHAVWLSSQFEDDVWQGELANIKINIDWRIKVNGRDLTSPDLAELCSIFKAWVIASTEPSSNEGREINDNGKHVRVKRTLRQIDYILLRAVEWGIDKYALRAVTEGNIASMIMSVEKYSTDTESHYEWSTRLSKFLLEKGEQISWQEMRRALVGCPYLWDFTASDEDGILDSLSRSQLKRARAFLWLNGYYRKDMSNGFQYIPKVIQIASEIYRNTLFGCETKPIPTELCLGSSESHVREYPGLSVRTSIQGAATQRRCRAQRASLATLAGLKNFGFNVPFEAITRVLSLGAISVDAYRPGGRYRTPPFEHMMTTLKNCVEFFQEHHEHVFQSYVNCINAAKKAQQSPGKFFLKTDIRDVLEEKTIKSGVKCWGLVAESFIGSRTHYRQRIAEPVYFAAFRANGGLVELVGVLFGAIFFVIGVLSARRGGELQDLPMNGCTDEDGENLLFFNRKTGSLGVREIQARPIPPICTKMIQALQQFNLKLERAGVAQKGVTLLRVPGYSGNYATHIKSYSRCLDLICDYFSMPVDKNGFRLYIRQHQLRRFFCMAFFWGCKYSEMEALRWFLGHSDIEYLWHYITESMHGEVLVYAKANFLAFQIEEVLNTSGENSFFEIDECSKRTLEEQISLEFGTDKVSLIDADALEEFIAFRIESGLSVEPVFIDSDDGKKVRIAVHFMMDNRI